MKLTFLGAAVPLTKTFNLNNRVLEKQAHPKVLNCTSYEENVNTIEEFKNALEAHAAQGHSLLKGNVNRKLDNESRASSTDANEKTSWACLDIDGIKGCSDVDDMLTPMGLADVDHIIQYSSSMGVVPDRGLSAHVFMLIDEAMPEHLKRWLMNENMSQEILSKNLGLTRTGNALRWPLDVSTCQNDKLIYIAPPLLGPGVKDSLKGKRILLQKRKRRSFVVPVAPAAPALKQLTEKAVNLVRASQGLTLRPPTTYKQSGSIEYIANPEKAQVTGIKEDGNFIHLNINGGDSWAYWHFKSNAEFIYNFKNEPTYRTAELLPEYWETVRPSNDDPVPSVDGTEYLVFRNFNTATYHNAIWTPATKELKIAQARSVGQLTDFLKSHGLPKQDFIADWTIVFDPHSEIIVDHENRVINEFQPSEYMLAKPSKGARVPPIIHKTIWNAFGSDQETYEYLLNWAAVIFQYHCRAETAWLTYGTTGTGKGTFANLILAPIFKYVEFKRSRDLMSPYNEFLERSLILVVDEAELGGKNGGSIVESDLRNFITEPILSIRKMYMASYAARSFVSAIFNANVDVPLNLKDNDRRVNVAPFQKQSITYKTGERESIKDELMEMAQFLAAYPADRGKARSPLMNEARRTLIWMGKAGMDSVTDHLKKGDYQFFVDGRQAIYTAADVGDNTAAAYAILVESMKKRDYLLREELQLLLGYLMDKVPKSPYKFVSFIKHHGIVLEDVVHEGKTYKGYKTKWVTATETGKTI